MEKGLRASPPNYPHERAFFIKQFESASIMYLLWQKTEAGIVWQIVAQAVVAGSMFLIVFPLTVLGEIWEVGGGGGGFVNSLSEESV